MYQAWDAYRRNLRISLEDNDIMGVIRQEIRAYNRSSTTTYDDRLLVQAYSKMRLKIPKEQSEYVNRRRTDNNMFKIKRLKGKKRSTSHTHKTKDRVTRTPLNTGFFAIYQLITFDRLFFSKYNTAKIKIWLHYLLTQGIRLMIKWLWFTWSISPVEHINLLTILFHYRPVYTIKVFHQKLDQRFLSQSFLIV
jgi:hypothetical protein